MSVRAIGVIIISLYIAASAEREQKQCFVTETSENGYIRPGNKTTYEVGEIVKYFCKVGFRLKGRPWRRCVVRKSETMLKGYTPKCKDDNECRRNPCHKHAYCINVQGSYVCLCKSGYAGDGVLCFNETILDLPSKKPGCYVNGNYYPPGATISSGRFGSFCFSERCPKPAYIYDITIISDDFNCSADTELPHEYSPTPAVGCEYEGKLYPPGETISAGRKEKWCYWIICDRDNIILQAHNFNCPKEYTNPYVSPTPSLVGANMTRDNNRQSTTVMTPTTLT